MWIHSDLLRPNLLVHGGQLRALPGALIVPYYAETNRGFVALARRTIEEVIAGSPV